ncbi:MAG: ribosomal protein S18-alanine N-acetyltransferase [Methylotenera sp.]|uniref:ribosomal protein S18-alanine N-acetyltransferase n=1 Tax=Methylotenera sp. TaxID=2051956 RepID=UPI002722B7B9|nr:ribosomal protein S18-alanine N-acetyltransferase [Methylotenera sp.]MDO9206334.1 ribosomal protein S18-alanine N-acetyltransferase [Methylotenera sp.]MDO9394017.1 ribosomal protein S18-alanine N-acetyltransferase [Methylotenera sp.]MDP1523066.1 ribosomal protein S18-alanine N-acetyltransferase [Methylotenera sp.]MDP2231604.1 ribosomal protein S18-alanine N-acetyltransferase [Methylotenera sp.]MDP3308018.1 ribosomal protein S18-alanine N-acetyltransferase [Methylotenera sp.]
MSAMLKTQYQFRPMQMDDLDAVMAIEPHIYPYPWTRGNFSDSLSSGYSAWVLVSNEQIIAYSLMMMVLDEAHLLNLSVAKDYQKQGMGRLLLEYMVGVAKNNQLANMFLEVRPSNIPAIALYENMGFNEMAIRRAYYPAVDGREDAVLMGLAL